MYISTEYIKVIRIKRYMQYLVYGKKDCLKWATYSFGCVSSIIFLVSPPKQSHNGCAHFARHVLATLKQYSPMYGFIEPLGVCFVLSPVFVLMLLLFSLSLSLSLLLALSRGNKPVALKTQTHGECVSLRLVSPKVFSGFKVLERLVDCRRIPRLRM